VYLKKENSFQPARRYPCGGVSASSFLSISVGVNYCIDKNPKNRMLYLCQPDVVCINLVPGKDCLANAN